MQTLGKIIIITACALFVILAIIFLQSSPSTKATEIYCNQTCVPSNENSWIVLGVKNIEGNSFTTQQDCIQACNDELKKNGT